MFDIKGTRQRGPTESGVFSLPYLFDSVEHNLRVVTDQRINDLYSEMTRAVVDGGHSLTLYSSPLRNFYSKDTEVRSVDDIQNQKIRVQATRTEDITFAAYGAQTVHMQFSEVFTSLQTGVRRRCRSWSACVSCNEDFMKAAVLYSLPMMAVAGASALAYVIAYLRAPEAVTALVEAIAGTNPTLIMFLIVVALVIAGDFLDATPTIVIAMPVIAGLVELGGIEALFATVYRPLMERTG